MKKNVKAPAKISSTKRLEELLEETENELVTLEPQIEKLERQLEKLKELKLAKQKLITLKLSIKSILNNFSESQVNQNTTSVIEDDFRKILSPQKLNKKYSTSPLLAKTNNSSALAELDKTFLPELAFQEASAILRRKSSLNYELFRAIVFNGGQADTESVKQYLVENNIKQPASGQGFEDVELTDISSRINYLVRKGLITPEGRGTFVSNLGWAQS